MVENKEIIVCPHCKQSFALHDAVDIEAVVQQRLSEAERINKDEAKAREKQLAEKIRKEIQDKENLEKADLQNQLMEQKKITDKARNDQLEANKKLRMAEEKEKSIDIEVEKRAITLAQQEKQKVEVALAEKNKIQLSIKEKDIEQKYSNQINDKDQQILLLKKEKEDTQKKLEEAKRANSQVSQQAQGEVFELDFERRLKEEFPEDEIDEVPKGIEGADFIQTVYNKGKKAGIILWETKNTKGFSKQWIEKLKTEQRKLAAEVSVIATNTLPKDSAPIDQRDGVYIVSLAMALPLAMVLRRAVIRVSETATANENVENKAVEVYQYLISPNFKQKIEAIISAYQFLYEGTAKEERAMKKIWAERRKMLSVVVDSTVGMYGELQGIAGKEIPTIEKLELDATLSIEEDEGE
ncbi:MAG: DUF2130 domain-containing protein [Hydrotalea sp.]|nr:DUF2130 domain-containing protein [Hydrotalea sp.]